LDKTVCQKEKGGGRLAAAFWFILLRALLSAEVQMPKGFSPFITVRK